MSKLYELKNEKSWKSLLITDNLLQLINKDYDSVEEFEKGFAEKGLFKEKKEIVISSITQLVHKEADPTSLKIVYSNNSTIDLTFAETENLLEAATILSTQLSLKREVKEMGKLKAITPQLIGIGITALLTWLLHSEAQTLEAGGTIDTSGRRALVKKLLAFVAEKLGSTGTLIAGGVTIIVFVFLLNKNLKTPPKEVVYE